MKWSTVGVSLLPNEIILIFSQGDNRGKLYFYFWMILVLLLIFEIFSLSMIFGIFSYLQKHTSGFSKSTLRLHMQFAMLLGAQVRFWCFEVIEGSLI
jgi:hypothetical protein